MAVAGGISLVAYLNFLTVGFTLQEYTLFLIQRIETYVFIAGTILVWIIVYPSLSRNRVKNKKNK